MATWAATIAHNNEVIQCLFGCHEPFKVLCDGTFVYHFRRYCPIQNSRYYSQDLYYQIPGVPVIIGLRNALLLEQPSAFQHQFAKSAEKERSHMTELEYQMINMGTKKLVTE
ncbi:unnamed protein product [Ilex paraguariensis]|uniref:Uncharacterized protein n=1 Tax=Ilex paraguariensis TaxID=185542 RepID=A0ABC8SHL4_9AQUA